LHVARVSATTQNTFCLALLQPPCHNLYSALVFLVVLGAFGLPNGLLDA
jgi:hypothetical protein